MYILIFRIIYISFNRAQKTLILLNPQKLLRLREIKVYFYINNNYTYGMKQKVLNYDKNVHIIIPNFT